MPIMTLRGGTLAGGLAWLRRGPEGPVRRLTLGEWAAEVAEAGFEQVECVYRFRDRVTLRGVVPAGRSKGIGRRR